MPKGSQVRRIADRDVEFAVGQVRLDIHVEDGNDAAEEARRIFRQLFKAADANKDGYLEGKELAAITKTAQVTIDPRYGRWSGSSGVGIEPPRSPAAANLLASGA